MGEIQMNKKILVSAIMIAAICTGTPGAQAQSITKRIEGLAHPESVAGAGQYLYVGNVGEKLQPSAKDGDGFISKVNMKTGAIEEMHFLPKEGATLNAPKGLTVVGNILYLVDIDRVVGFNLESGEMVFKLNIPEAGFLNDVVAKDPQTLYVSATNIGKIAKVDVPNQSYQFLDIPKVDGANGLDLNADKTVLYCVGYGNNGQIHQITLNPLHSKTVTGYQGLLDGAQYDKGTLYFSDWKSSDKNGIINTLDTQSNEIKTLDLEELMGGPADFYLDKESKTLYVPAMLESKIYVVKL